VKRHLNLLRGAAESLDRHRVRGVVTVMCLVAAVVPYLAALWVQEGVRAEAVMSITGGPDLYVASSAFGQNAAVPLSIVPSVRSIPGVRTVRPRITGRLFVGRRLVTLVGVDDPTAALAMVPDAAPAPLAAGQTLVGAGVAKDLGLKRGDGFAIEGSRLVSLQVTEVFGPASGIHAAGMVVVTLADAAAIFGIDDHASDLLVWVEPGAEERVANAVREALPRARVQTRELVQRYVTHGLSLRAGAFAALNIAALALAVPALLITSGMGLAERRREIGILKATGWSTEEVLEIAFLECLLMALVAAGLAALAAWTWLRPLNGWIIAQFLIAGTGASPTFTIPASFTLAPVGVVFLVCLATLVVGAVPASWRAATVPPAEVLR
jgi:ABC-type lipoprotein release transport system permease subunit